MRRSRLPTSVPEGMTPEIFRKLMMRDKKNKDGQIRLILLKVTQLWCTSDHGMCEIG